ncbi:MAG: HAD family phosphatase [Spirochaetes bacterium]|nr:HAD family phosphatase [Spirochaetota bacterium]
MSPHAILFDMDGVIVDSMKYHAAAWKRVLGDYGIIVDDIDIFRREGMSGRQSIEDIFSEKGGQLPGDEEFGRMLERKHALFESNEIRIYPGVEEMLLWISGRSVPMALVTGSLMRSVEHVMPAGLLALFGAVITAGDVTNGKPSPEPYARALERLGADPAGSLTIENAPMGIRSARNAGLKCYALETTLPPTYLEEADRIFHDHASLLEYLKSTLLPG